MKKVLWLLPAAVSFFCPAADKAVEYTREDYIPDHAGLRSAVSRKVMIYPEVQYKYGMFQNFLGMYIDRPLFFDRATRYPSGSYDYLTQESYFRDIAVMKLYGVDGSGSLAIPLLKNYKQVNRFLKADPERSTEHLEFPQFAFAPVSSDAMLRRQIDSAKEILRIALKSPYAPKLDGRILITTYNSGWLKAEQLKIFQDALHQEFGSDSFLLTGSLSVLHPDRQEMQNTGRWSPETQEKYRRKIIRVLTLFDGIQIPLTFDIRKREYMTEPDFRIYDQYLLPMLREIRRKPEFSGKLYGFVIKHGYINHMTGVTHGEYGTARLRLQMDRIVRMDPDFIVLFEWNEFNENTCFQPTLRNSMALQRLIRYYCCLLKGRPLQPNPGDDTAIPPLILSARETVRCGEIIRFELLNVPDTETPADFQAELSLYDLNGRKLCSFPKETFNRSKMRAVTYRVPSEQFSMLTALRPILKITKTDGKEIRFDQLQTVRLHPTVCKDYKEVRQPLRDLIIPQTADLRVEKLPDGRYRLSGKFESSEKLAALEVLDQGREIYAVDPVNEFDRDNNIIVRGSISTKHSRMRNLEIQLVNAGKWKFRPWEQANISFGKWRQKGNTVRSQTHVWSANNQFLLIIPRNAAAQAEIRFAVDGESRSLKIADLLKTEKYAEIYKNCRVDWEVYHELPDIPLHPGQKKLSFSTTVKSLNRFPQFQLRAVSVSGKIWRGPVLQPCDIPPETEKMNIYSETSGKIETVQVPQALIPDLHYCIDPAAGAILKNTYEPKYDAQLGGGFVYDEPAYRLTLPDNTSFAPVYVEEDNGPALEFKKISYINFPSEAFPRGSFTMTFEIKPDRKSRPYVIFRHYSWILGSVTIFAKSDRFCLAFGDKDLKKHLFATGLKLVPDEWSKVKICFDQKSLTFSVNGKTKCYPVPAPMLALYFKPAIFGGHLKAEFGLPSGAEFFSGQLRRFEIRHNASDSD